jgi:uncharacterized lipoprotein YmbA
MRFLLMKMRSVSLFSLVTALLGGCIPDLKSDLPPDRVYWLEVPEITDAPAVELSLSVVPGLDSDRIWLLQQDQRLNYYAGAYWPDNLRPLLESLLIRSMGEQNSDSQMHVLVERFFALELGDGVPPEIEVRALLHSEGVRCRFERRDSAGGDRLRDVVAGHQRVLDELAAALAEFARTGHCL